MIAVRVERTIQRYGAVRAELLLNLPQHRPAGEAKVNIKAGNLLGAQVRRFPPLPQLCQGNGSINVVENFDSCRIRDPFNDFHSFGKVRTHYRDIRLAQLTMNAWHNFVPFLIEDHLAPLRIGKITVRGIPFDIFLEKNNFVATCPQSTGQRAKGGRMAVSP